jgi:hypothetical protein
MEVTSGCAIINFSFQLSVSAKYYKHSSYIIRDEQASVVPPILADNTSSLQGILSFENFGPDFVLSSQANSDQLRFEMKILPINASESQILKERTQILS